MKKNGLFQYVLLAVLLIALTPYQVFGQSTKLLSEPEISFELDSSALKVKFTEGIRRVHFNTIDEWAIWNSHGFRHKSKDTLIFLYATELTRVETYYPRRDYRMMKKRIKTIHDNIRETEIKFQGQGKMRIGQNRAKYVLYQTDGSVGCLSVYQNRLTAEGVASGVRYNSGGDQLFESIYCDIEKASMTEEDVRDFLNLVSFTKLKQ